MMFATKIGKGLPFRDQGHLRGLILPLCRGSVAHNSKVAASGKVQYKSMTDLPCPPGWPVFGNLLQFMSFAIKGRAHLYYKDLAKKHGDFFRIKNVNQHQVVISDPFLVEEVLRKEIKTPKRPSGPSWDDFRVIHNEEHGLLTSFGEEWQKNRSALNKQMLRPENVNQYCTELGEIVGDLMARLDMVKLPTEGGFFVPELANELYKWSLESICAVMFETRLGCLKKEIDPKIQYFIDNINSMFDTTVLLYIGYGLQKKLNTKPYKRHMKNWSVIFEVAREHIEKRTKELKTAATNDDTQTAFLTRLLLNKELSPGNLRANVAELLLAAVDTTSNTLCFMLYNLANNPRVQEKLSEEISSVVGNTNCVDTKQLEQMNYLKLCLKENLRMFPVAPIIARILTGDLSLNGYHIPKDTLVILANYTSSRDEKYFHDPDTFIPERWSRTDGDEIHPFASLPFGHGSRSCIGRRFAELELKLSIIQIVKKYKIVPHKSMTLKPFCTTILSPGKDVPVIFHLR